MNEVNLITVFLTGLLTGGLTCLAVQGGLLASTIAQRHEQVLAKKAVNTGHALPILSFLFAKIIAYTFLGFLLGLLGSFFIMSLTTKFLLQMAVAIFMFGTAMNLLNVHPFFRYFAIQPPHFLLRFIRKRSKRADLFAPVLLGALTVFIPCGTTQAVMALAIGTGNPVTGALILLSFTLGTSPVFFALGYLATRLGEKFQTRFLKVAALSLILLSIYTLDGSLALAGVSTPSKVISNVYCSLISQCKEAVLGNTSPSTDLTIHFEPQGYSPQSLSVKAGSHVVLKLVNANAAGCVQAFTIPNLGIQKIVSTGSSSQVEFDAPTTPGTLAFMCSMGMFRGEIRVI